jgi:peptidoglycan/LPS O-acetylase OafA/YrhL
MKKAVILFIVAALVLITVGIWIFTSKINLTLMDITSFGVIILLVTFAIILGFKRLGSARRGEPAEDELSKRIMQKASSLSFYISIYLWLVIMYLSDKVKMATHTLIGTGILGMAVTFAVCWLVIKITGIKNE